MDDSEAEVEPVASADRGFYPDIARSSTLRIALQAEFDQAGHDLDVLVPSAPGWRDVGAVVRHGARSVDVVLASQERSFTMQFWADGIRMAHGSTAALDAVAGATRVWLSGALVRELNAAWSFAEFSPFSEACERGEGVEFTWQRYHANPRQAPQLTALRSFIAAAMREPRLRALYPFTSMGTLGFRATVRHSPAINLSVRPQGNDRYLVRGPDGAVGVAEAADSVALALRVLDAIAQH